LKSSFKNIELFCIRSEFNAGGVMILFSEFEVIHSSLSMYLKSM